MKEPMSAMKNMMKAQAMKMPIRKTENLVGGQKKLDKDKDGDLDAKDFAMLRKTKSEAVKTGEADAEPKVKELNAMVKNPMNAMKDPMNAMKDMNATYMKSNVKASVMNNGGADMAKVKDAPAMNDPMKKINATYGAAKEVMDIAADKNKMMKKETVERAYKYLETKPGSLEEAVLIARGLIEKKSLNEAKYQLGMREFNFFKGNDLMKAMNQTKKDGNSEKALDDLQMYGGDEEDRITFTANNPSEAARNAEKAILTFRNKNLKNDRNALSVMKYLELEQVDGKTPTTQQKSSLKRVLDKFDIEVQFNTPNGKGSSNLEKFVKDEALDDMVTDGVM
jgi:hypothetical protein